MCTALALVFRIVLEVWLRKNTKLSVWIVEVSLEHQPGCLPNKWEMLTMC